jgi:ABC-2 type transport system ATP-binding protein
MSTVQLDHIRKVYETKVAVEGLSLRIEPGTMFGLLGPNGSGKTSSIRMMIGITVPDSGTVTMFDKPFHRDSLKRVGYLPEERGLYKKMNVLEQIVFMGQLRGLTTQDAETRGKKWADRLQITEALPKKTEELSKGMQQKIQFITALIHEPELIIMDEPFSGLDPVNGALLQDTLMELRAAGRAILFSTHRMDQVEKMCDSITLIHRGRVVLEGSMRDIKSAYPRNRVDVVFEGDNSFLRNAVVEDVKEYGGGMATVKLRGDGVTTMPDAQPLLVDAIARGTRISRFEVKEPTLEEIFIERVGGNVDA